MKPIKLDPLSIDTPLLKARVELSEVASPKTKSFGSLLNNAMNNLDDVNHATAHKIEDFLAGKNTEVHDVMLSMEKTQMAMNLSVEIRNRMVDAYDEIIRMQI